MNWSKICTFVREFISDPRNGPGAIYSDNTLMCITVIYTHYPNEYSTGTGCAF